MVLRTHHPDNDTQYHIDLLYHTIIYNVYIETIMGDYKTKIITEKVNRYST